MSKRFRYVLMCFVSLSPLGYTSAQAQPPAHQPSYRPPTVSPYLNLLRRGAGPGFNYFTLVRPELDLRGAIRQLQLGLGDLRRQQQLLEQEDFMPVTGHPTYFMNTGWYFNVGPRQGATATPDRYRYSSIRRPTHLRNP